MSAEEFGRVRKISEDFGRVRMSSESSDEFG